MLKCGTLSKRETKQVNKCVRRALDEEAKDGKECSATRGACINYTPEDRAKIGR